MIPFRKMNGLGNDFVVIDARRRPRALSPERIAALADRGSGIGFDQFITIAPARETGHHARMRIVNADGGEVESCGNAARCVAALLLDETGHQRVNIESDGGLMTAWRGKGARIAVDMGVPRFGGADIPLGQPGDPQALVLDGFAERFGPAACVNVGNPHAVFFIDDTDSVPLAEVGPQLEHHPAFPQRANISFVAIENGTRVRARVWERGVGATRACGTAACAIGALLHHLGRAEPTVTVVLPGGPLTISQQAGRIVMEGPYALDFVGSITETSFLRDPLPAV
ncbi:MAG: diaminopimelate epimerase [Pseudomonadota bacterium]